MKRTKPKIVPWPNSTFALKTRWEDWGTDKHFFVYLERRAPGKFGRLDAMHGIVPSGRHKSDADLLFGSARYRRGTLDRVREVFELAGVPEDQAQQFMDTILSQYAYPTVEQVFLEQINSPLMTIALGERRKELSYHRTGVPELTEEDVLLFKQCVKEWETRIKASPGDRERFLKVMLGSSTF